MLTYGIGRFRCVQILNFILTELRCVPVNVDVYSQYSLVEHLILQVQIVGDKVDYSFLVLSVDFIFKNEDK